MAGSPNQHHRPTYLATTVHGLEWVTADEIDRRLGPVERPALHRRRVLFTTTDPVATLGLRTADDVFVLVAEVDGLSGLRRDLDHLGTVARRLDWAPALATVAAVRPVTEQPVFDVAANVDGRPRYNRFEVEGAVGRAFADVTGGTYLARTAAGRDPGDPVVSIRVVLDGGRALVGLRMAATPIHRRSYKTDTAAGTLHPPVAAALVALGGDRRHRRHRQHRDHQRRTAARPVLWRRNDRHRGRPGRTRSIGRRPRSRPGSGGQHRGQRGPGRGGGRCPDRRRRPPRARPRPDGRHRDEPPVASHRLRPGLAGRHPRPVLEPSAPAPGPGRHGDGDRRRHPRPPARPRAAGLVGRPSPAAPAGRPVGHDRGRPANRAATEALPRAGPVAGPGPPGRRGDGQRVPGGAVRGYDRAQAIDQPPSEGRITPLRLVPPSERRKVIDAASWAELPPLPMDAGRGTAGA